MGRGVPRVGSGTVCRRGGIVRTAVVRCGGNLSEADCVGIAVARRVGSPVRGGRGVTPRASVRRSGGVVFPVPVSDWPREDESRLDVPPAASRSDVPRAASRSDALLPPALPSRSPVPLVTTRSRSEAPLVIRRPSRSEASLVASLSLSRAAERSARGGAVGLLGTELSSRRPESLGIRVLMRGAAVCPRVVHTSEEQKYRANNTTTRLALVRPMSCCGLRVLSTPWVF